jgi:hypothetical protein
VLLRIAREKIQVFPFHFALSSDLVSPSHFVCHWTAMWVWSLSFLGKRSGAGVVEKTSGSASRRTNYLVPMYGVLGAVVGAGTVHGRMSFWRSVLLEARRAHPHGLISQSRAAASSSV